MLRRSFVAACIAITFATPALAKPTEAELALAAVNAVRAQAGLAPVTLDKKMSQACALHAEYLRKNHGTAGVAGLGAHKEDPTRPGYSAAGADAGKNADIAYVPLVAAVDMWMNSLYHRTPILRPSLKKVGAASVKGPAGPISLLMFEPTPDDGAGYPVRYPADGQTGVPLAFTGEVPDPVPAGEPPAGSPVTIAFGFQKVKDASGELRDEAGDEVPVHFSSPEKPATFFQQGGVVCLIPKRPLAPSAKYTATVRATVGGEKKTWTWSFRTAEPLEIDASQIAEVEGSLGKLVRLSGDVRHAGTIPTHSFLVIGTAHERVRGGGPAESSAMVSVLIPNEAWPAFKAAGIRDLSHYSGQRVEALGVPARAGASDVNVNVYVSSPAELRIVAVELPLLDANGPEPGASVGKLVRVRGDVRFAGKIAGFVFLQIGESDGRMVSAFVPESAWPRMGVDLAKVSGRTVTARGVIQLVDGKYLNVTVDRPDQLEWN